MKTLSEFMSEGYMTRLVQKLGRFKSTNYDIVHNKTGKSIGKLVIDKSSGDHHFHLHDGRGFTLQKHEISGKDPQAVINHFLKKLERGEHKPDSSRKFGPFGK